MQSKRTAFFVLLLGSVGMGTGCGAPTALPIDDLVMASDSKADAIRRPPRILYYGTYRWIGEPGRDAAPPIQLFSLRKDKTYIGKTRLASMICLWCLADLSGTFEVSGKVISFGNGVENTSGGYNIEWPTLNNRPILRLVDKATNQSFDYDYLQWLYRGEGEDCTTSWPYNGENERFHFLYDSLSCESGFACLPANWDNRARTTCVRTDRIERCAHFYASCGPGAHCEPIAGYCVQDGGPFHLEYEGKNLDKFGRFSIERGYRGSFAVVVHRDDPAFDEPVDVRILNPPKGVEISGLEGLQADVFEYLVSADVNAPKIQGMELVIAATGRRSGATRVAIMDFSVW